MQILKHDALSANVRLSDLTFKTTQELLNQSDGNQPQSHGWIAQAEAKKQRCLDCRCDRPVLMSWY
jgi:hypothetical protein